MKGGQSKPSHCKDINRLIGKLTEEGLVVQIDNSRGAHVKAVLKNGRKVPVPSTPSAGPRVILNLEAQIRRAARIEPGSKSC